MAWFLLVWAGLTAALAGATAFLSIAVFRHLDLRYVTLVQLLIIPTVQTLVVGWVTRQWSASRLMWAARETLHHRLVTALILVNAAVLALGQLLVELPGGDPGDRGRVIALWSGLQTACAAVVLLRAIARGTIRQRRRWLLALAVCALAVTAGIAIHWLGAPDPFRGLMPRAARWLAGIGGSAAIALLVLVRAAAAVRGDSPLAGLYFELAAASLFAMALVGVLNVFLHPFLSEPWSTLAAALALCSATSVLAGSLLALPARELSDPRA